MSILKNDLSSMKSDLEEQYNNQLLRTNTILNNALTDASLVVLLEQHHFDKGPVEIAPDYYLLHDQSGNYSKTYMDTSGMVFRLKESIIFNPNPAVIDGSMSDISAAEAVWKSNEPTMTQFTFMGGPYDPAAYGIGFFAAVVLSAKNVVLDLNGYSIQQGKSHYINQRFYSNIELGDLPFIPGAGPHSFGDKLTPAKKVSIINGNLGLSSHHGIHGNNCEDILMKDITFKDYEVATIHINGGKNLSLVNLTGKGSCDKCPILGTFSAGRFLRPYLDHTNVKDFDTKIAGVILTNQFIRDSLRDALYNAWNDIVNGTGTIDKDGHPTEWSLFNNEKLLVDGVGYGLALNKVGPAVNGFPKNRDTDSNNIYMKNVSISNHKANIREIPTLKVLSSDGLTFIKPSTNDAVGAVFQTQNVDADGNLVTINQSGNYVGNVVSNAQIAVAKRVIEGINLSPLSTSRLNISQAVVDFAAGDISTLHDDPSGSRIGTYTFNGDSMFHVVKGPIGFKLDAVYRLYAEDCRLYNQLSTGDIGLTESTLPVPVETDTSKQNYIGYYSKKELGNPLGTLKQYSGAETYGVSCFSSKDVWLSNFHADGITSNYGGVMGVRVDESSVNILLENCSFLKLNGGANVTNNSEVFKYESNPTPKPDVYGVYVGTKPKNVQLCNLHVNELSSFCEKNNVLLKNNDLQVSNNNLYLYSYGVNNNTTNGCSSNSNRKFQVFVSPNASSTTC